MYCKNCKYWERLNYYTKEQTYNFGKETEFYRDKSEMDNAKGAQCHISKFGECHNEKIVYTSAGGCVEDDDGNPSNPTDGFLYSDGEGYGAYHMTGENFGCIKF